MKGFGRRTAHLHRFFFREYPRGSSKLKGLVFRRETEALWFWESLFWQWLDGGNWGTVISRESILAMILAFRKETKIETEVLWFRDSRFWQWLAFRKETEEIEALWFRESIFLGFTWRHKLSSNQEVNRRFCVFLLTVCLPVHQTSLVNSVCEKVYFSRYFIFSTCSTVNIF